jgi:hypothetical protein
MPQSQRGTVSPRLSVASSAAERKHSRMVAAAITLWVMFSLWLVAPLMGARRGIRKLAALVLWAELIALLMWSYGVERCTEPTCAPLAQAAGIAARTDVPAIAGIVLLLSVLQFRRSARVADAPAARREPARPRGR